MVEGKSLTFIHYFLRVFYDLKGRVIERGRDTDLSLRGHSPMATEARTILLPSQRSRASSGLICGWPGPSPPIWDAGVPERGRASASPDFTHSCPGRMKMKHVTEHVGHIKSIFFYSTC